MIVLGLMVTYEYGGRLRYEFFPYGKNMLQTAHTVRRRLKYLAMEGFSVRPTEEQKFDARACSGVIS